MLRHFSLPLWALECLAAIGMVASGTAQLWNICCPVSVPILKVACQFQQGLDADERQVQEFLSVATLVCSRITRIESRRPTRNSRYQFSRVKAMMNGPLAFEKLIC